MTTFTAEQLDLSRLPAFQLVTVDAAAEEASLKAGIVARYRARGILYDVQSLESDFGMIAAEEFAYRKVTSLQALNDAAKRLTLTYGYGAALDQLAATMFADLGLRRLALVENPRPFVPGTDAAADWESDDRFRLRISLAPQARSPGTLGGYEYAALTAAPFLTDAIALNYASGLARPGQIVVVLLGRDPDPNPQTAKPAEEEPAQILLAQASLLDRNEKLGSDEIIVRAARRVTAARGYRLGVRPGPDPTLILLQAKRGYATMLAAGRRIGRLISASDEITAICADNAVAYVHAKPGTSGDLDPGLDGVAVPVPDLTLETIGG